MRSWIDALQKEAQEIVRHGQGKLTFNVGPLGKDQTSIMIEAGKSNRFIIQRLDNDLED